MAQNIAIVGATGAVGAELIRLLEQRSYPVDTLRLFASSKSAGRRIEFNGEELLVKELTPNAFKGIDIAFFATGGPHSKEVAPVAVKAGAIVIDNSSAFRLDEHTPLVVPEVNPEAVFAHRGIIANPNCATTQMVVALNPLHQHSRIKRIIVSTYQAVSGAGREAIDELTNQLRAFVRGDSLVPNVFPATIGLNVIPQIDVFSDNGYTGEEIKMVHETKKILGDPEIKVSATCVRVPVLRAHSEAIHIETEAQISVAVARELLSAAPGIKVIDQHKPGGYPTPAEVSETNYTWIGRIREDLSHPNGLVWWVVADQLWKGAALNAIQIAELLRQENRK